MRRQRNNYYYGGWAPYVSVAERRSQAMREMHKLRKQGQEIEPIEIEGRTIAGSFWGKGWCSHLESFGDYSNRLPRGRTYVRNGSVCHLSIARGKVEAIVSGSELYHVTVDIAPLKESKWSVLKQRCTGKIGSLIELLQGNLSAEIMDIVIDREHGLFPLSGEIKYRCDCPDIAGMCKHIAAIMYGIGARLDTQPELLFLLRGVDHEELIAADAAAEAITGGGSGQARRRSLAGQDLESVFGVELEDMPEAVPRRRTSARKAAKKKVATRKPERKEAGGNGSPSKPRRAAPFRPSARSVTALRHRLGMSKAEFASAVGVSSATVTNWESAAGAINPQGRGLAGLIRLHERSAR